MASVGELRVDISTETFKKKLRAIAKHAEALADELDVIDKSVCKECGSSDVRARKVRATDETFNHFNCVWCGNTWND